MIHTTFGPILINFAPLEVVNKVEVKQMIGLAMDNFAEKQTTEDEEFRRIMQQAIATQFSSLGESLILNLQQAEMHLFNIVATTPMLLPLVQPQPPVSISPTLPIPTQTQTLSLDPPPQTTIPQTLSPPPTYSDIPSPSNHLPQSHLQTHVFANDKRGRSL